jgi:hypothetical protein
MDGLLAWALMTVAGAIALCLGFAVSAADPIGRFLHRQLWPDPKDGVSVEK